MVTTEYSYIKYCIIEYLACWSDYFNVNIKKRIDTKMQRDEKITKVIIVFCIGGKKTFVINGKEGDFDFKVIISELLEIIKV